MTSAKLDSQILQAITLAGAPNSKRDLIDDLIALPPPGRAERELLLDGSGGGNL